MRSFRAALAVATLVVGGAACTNFMAGWRTQTVRSVAIGQSQDSVALVAGTPQQRSVVSTASGRVEVWSFVVTGRGYGLEEYPIAFRDGAVVALGRQDVDRITSSTSSDPAAGSATKTDVEQHLRYVVQVYTPDLMGSGVLLTEDGGIVTNAHVVGNNRHVDVRLSDGRMLGGTVFARDPVRDLALITVAASDLPHGRLGEDARVGDDVYVIGSPYQLEKSVTRGIVSAVRTMAGVQWVQTDAAINHGNSGGPVICARTGRVIGIASWTRRESQGLGFAVSASEVAGFVRDLTARSR